MYLGELRGYFSTLQSAIEDHELEKIAQNLRDMHYHAKGGAVDIANKNSESARLHAQNLRNLAQDAENALRRVFAKHAS